MPQTSHMESWFNTHQGRVVVSLSGILNYRLKMFKKSADFLLAGGNKDF